MAIETQHIEFKRIWKDEYLKWICGFANSEGGQLFIGTDDNGNALGLDNPKKLMEDIPNKIASTLGVVAAVNLAEKKGNQYLAISVPASCAPVAYHGKYFVRSGATLQELSGTALQDFIMKKMGLTWESQAVPEATLDDIDPEAIKYFIEAGIEAKRIPESARNDSIEKVLKNRKLIDSHGRILLATLLLFGKDPQKYCLTSGIKIGMFGPGYSDLEGTDIIGGNLIQIVDKVIDLLDKKYLMRPIYYEGLRRREPLEIPMEALREILYNAVVHKEYRGPEITIRVFKDKIRIANEGNLPKEVPIDSLYQSHESKPRNELIASAFYAAGFIEAWGRGYEKIKNAFESENLQLPTVYEEGGFFCVEIKREKYIVISGYDKIMDKMNVTDGTINETNQGGPKGYSDTNETNSETNLRQIILTTVASHPDISVTDLASACKVSRATIYRMLALMTEDVIRVGSTRKGHWEIIKK